jgi:hypothetical protein
MFRKEDQGLSVFISWKWNEILKTKEKSDTFQSLYMFWVLYSKRTLQLYYTLSYIYHFISSLKIIYDRTSCNHELNSLNEVSEALEKNTSSQNVYV